MPCIRKKRKRMNLNTEKNFHSNKNNIYHYGNKECCWNIRYFVWVAIVVMATVVVMVVWMRHKVSDELFYEIIYIFRNQPFLA